MSSKYTDNTAIMQVIGCVFNDLSLLEYTEKYSIIEEDFPDQFHKIVFGSIYKIHEMGAKQITLENISDFLSTRPKSEAIFKKEKYDGLLGSIRASHAQFDEATILG
jgi:replicative DNA helicase